MITTSVYYSCFTCDGEKVMIDVDELNNKSKGNNTTIVQVKQNNVDDDYEDDCEDDYEDDYEDDHRDDENPCPESRSNTIKVKELIRDLDQVRIDASKKDNNSGAHKQDQSQDTVKGKRVSNINNQAECTINTIKKKEALRRSDRLYMLGKQSVLKRRERHFNQIAEERKRDTQFEKSFEKKCSSSRSTLTPYTGRSRAIRLYELSHTCDGEKIIINVDELNKKSKGNNTPIVQVKLNNVDDEQDQRQDTLKGKRASNIDKEAEELKSTINTRFKKKKALRRSDRLYMLGKQSVLKRRERHCNQIAEERKRHIQFEKSLEKKKFSSRSTLTPSTGRSRAIRLYELSRPKQVEGKLRRENLKERAKERTKNRLSFDLSSTCSSTAYDDVSSLHIDEEDYMTSRVEFKKYDQKNLSGGLILKEDMSLQSGETSLSSLMIDCHDQFNNDGNSKLSDDYEGDNKDDRDDENSCPESRSNTLKVKELIRDLDQVRTDTSKKDNDSGAHKQDQRQHIVKGKRVSNINKQAEELKCTINTIKKKKPLRRSDRLYMLGKQSGEQQKDSQSLSTTLTINQSEVHDGNFAAGSKDFDEELINYRNTLNDSPKDYEIDGTQCFSQIASLISESLTFVDDEKNERTKPLSEVKQSKSPTLMPHSCTSVYHASLE